MGKMTNYYDEDEDEEKIDDEQVKRNQAFAKRIAAEKAVEQKALQIKIQKEIDEGKVAGKKSPEPEKVKPKRKYKKRVKKEKKEKKVVKKGKKVKKGRFTIEEIAERRKLQHPVKIEVNEFNQFKVDYIKKKIHFTKDLTKKEVYIQALTKYNV